MRALEGRRLRRIHRRLLEAYGPRGWWPADTPFEVMVGAVLTQNTAWVNVERAIHNLREREVLSAPALLALPLQELAAAIRPSGYFNVKATRLRHLCQWYVEHGGHDGLDAWDTDALREGLLAVHGIGPETADDILLYAFRRPVFVIDAYTRRIYSRLGLIAGDEPYDTLRQAFEAALGPDEPLFNEYHALIVRHAKVSCSARAPRCGSCCLRQICGARRTNFEL